MLRGFRLSALDLKLLRELVRSRGHLAAVALVTACGIASFVTMRGSYEALVAAQARYYGEYRFADVFAGAKRAPRSLLARIAALPDVAVVYGRIVREVNLDVPGLAEPATGRLVSIPESGAPALNAVHLRRGRLPEPGSHGEVVASEAFAEANAIVPGTELAGVMNGRWQKLHIVGIGISPEYVNEIRGGDVFPDHRRFGVLWMGEEAMEAAFDMKGAFNDLALRLAAGASERDVIAAVDVLLAPYGGLGAYPRADQLSHRFLTDEIAQDRVTGAIAPAIFLAVAAFLIHNVLLRLVALQRAQIGVLKAFGYSTRAVAWHYIKLAAAMVLVGAAVGVGLGVWLGHGLTRLYENFFHFPALEFALSGANLVGVAAIAAATAALGAGIAVRRAARLAPAEAMRPESPPQFRPLAVERLGLVHLVPLALRMIFRHIERRPTRWALSVVGLAAATALLVISRFSFDALDEIVRVQFRGAMREDVAVLLNEAAPDRAVHELERLPGVLRVEPYRAVAARLRFEHRERRVGILGIDPDATLRPVLDRRLVAVAVPDEGLVLSAKLAEVLGMRPGDRVTVEVLEGRRPVREVVVAGLVDDVIGLSAYMRRDALARLMGEAPRVSGAYLATDPLALDDLYRQLKAMPAVAGVTLREASLRSFLDTIAENTRISTTVLVLFACAIAAGMVYNGARIALSEQAIELASLRILGFTQREVGAMLIGEQAITTVVAIPVGCLIGYGVCAWLVTLVAGDVIRLPLAISARTYVFAAGTIVATGVLSAGMVLYKLRTFDLVSVLKTRE
ncbi:MAG TPA: FtsX-like permease family protein [Burkholderiales bacterium]|nr:FtsX-like permease family protein [Burkholderiales bacterium]